VAGLLTAAFGETLHILLEVLDEAVLRIEPVCEDFINDACESGDDATEGDEASEQPTDGDLDIRGKHTKHDYSEGVSIFHAPGPPFAVSPVSSFHAGSPLFVA
jgi:hypothetical protein